MMYTSTCRNMCKNIDNAIRKKQKKINHYSFGTYSANFCKLKNLKSNKQLTYEFVQE